MKKKKDQIQRVVDAMRNGDISSLNQEEVKFFDICNIADNLITLYGPGKKTAQMVIETVKQRYSETIHYTTAYDYINRAQLIFNSRSGIDKKYFKGFIVEEIMTLITALKKDLYGDPQSTAHQHQISESNDTNRKVAHVSIDPKKAKELRESLMFLSEVLALDKEDPLINPDDEFETLVVTDDPKEAGFEDYVILDDEIADRLKELGAKKDENGNWK